MQLTAPASSCPNSETFVEEQAIGVGRWATGVPEPLELPVAAALPPSPLELTPLPFGPLSLPASPVLATAPLALVPLPSLLAPITAFSPQPMRARAAMALPNGGIDLESEILTLSRQARSKPSCNRANVQRPSKATVIWFEVMAQVGAKTCARISGPDTRAVTDGPFQKRRSARLDVSFAPTRLRQQVVDEVMSLCELLVRDASPTLHTVALPAPALLGACTASNRHMYRPNASDRRSRSRWSVQVGACSSRPCLGVPRSNARCLWPSPQTSASRGPIPSPKWKHRKIGPKALRARVQLVTLNGPAMDSMVDSSLAGCRP